MLAEKYGYTPGQVADLTPYQASMLLSSGTERVTWNEARSILNA